MISGSTPVRGVATPSTGVQSEVGQLRLKTEGSKRQSEV